MIVTLTANTTFDQTLFIPYLKLNHTHRARDVVVSMGGKPTDCAWILGTLGVTSRAVGLAGGANGRKIAAMLESRGVIVDFVEGEGESRQNTVVVIEDGSGQFTITTATLSASPQQAQALLARFRDALDSATVVVLGGTLPQGLTPDFYTHCISLARERGLPVIFDADEPNLSAGLAGHPTYIKPNQDELSALLGREIRTVAEAYTAGREIYARYGASPIISLGAEGGLAVLPDRAYRIPALPLQVVSTSGAGDGVLAGLAAGLWRGQTLEETLRLAFAIASAVCLMPGTADCRPQDVERLLPQIALLPYP
jgi:1-phosphofructokinase family hexose kinase